MEFNKSVIDIIKERTSVRSYQKNQPLTEDTINKISDYIDPVKGPFEAKVTLKVLDSRNIDKDSDIKLGTYGIIKGTSTFIVSSVKKDIKSLRNLGYVLEKVILYSTSLGLGTCWLGGTFKRSEFAKTIPMEEDELMPIVSPLGYPSEKRGLVESLMRIAAGSNKRKSWSELFYNKSFSASLTEDASEEFKVPLEMLRLAPSASNKQPWRVLKEGRNFHFYLAHTPGYSSSLGYDIQQVDIGIAMCHFEAAAKELSLNGSWAEKSPTIDSLPQNTDYIISWVSE